MHNRQLTKVHLVGELGNRFGEDWALDVRSPAEAVRAIDINTKGKFGEYLSGEARDYLYEIALDQPDNVIYAEEAKHRTGNCDIWIMPAIHGGDSSLGKVIAGLALIAMVFVPALAPMMGYAIGGAKFGVTIGALFVSFGIALTIGGIAQALTPRAQTPDASPDQNPSKAFQGNGSAIVQGNCVPVVYGRALVPAIPIALSIANQPFNTTIAGSVDTIDSTELDGGGTQYDPPVGEGAGPWPAN